MSAHLERRLSRLERQIAPEIATDECDPKLAEFFQQIANGQFKNAAVPCGISASDFLDDLLAKTSGNVLGVANLAKG
jgi:hypothetical protein